MKILLDYVLQVTAITPTPAANTAFLKQVLVLVSPKMGVTPGVAVLCTTSQQVAALTDNTEVAELFAAGLSRVYVMPVNDLDIADEITPYVSNFYTVLVSSDFDDADIEATAATGNLTITSYANLVSGTADTVAVAGQLFTAQAGAATPGAATFQAATSNNATALSLAAQINAHTATKDLVTAVAVGAIVNITAKVAGAGGNAIALAYTDNDTNVGATKSGTLLTGGDGFFLGTFKGVVGLTSIDDAFLAEQAVITNRVAFPRHATFAGKNMFYAFGKILSNALSWLNQQYIPMPYEGDVDNIGEANGYFDEKISFVIPDDEFSNRLGLFAAGGEAIIAPYVVRNLEIDIQSKSLQFFSGNQPTYTKTNAALLEDELQKVVDLYISRQWINDGKVTVKLEQDNFVASADINIAKPNAFWRVFANLKQTLS